MKERAVLKYSILSWIRRAMIEPYGEDFSPEEHFDNLAEPTLHEARGLDLIKACCEILIDAKKRITTVEGGSPGRVAVVSFPIATEKSGLQLFDEAFWHSCGSDDCPSPTIHVHQNIPWSDWPFTAGNEIYWKSIDLPIEGVPEIRAGYQARHDARVREETPYLLSLYLELKI